MQAKLDYLTAENEDLKVRVSELEQLVKMKNDMIRKF